MSKQTKQPPAKRQTQAKSKQAAAQTTLSEKRRLKQKSYKSFRLSKPIKYQGKKLPSALQFAKRAMHVLWQHKKLFGGILLVYGILQIVLVQGILGTDFSQINDAVRDESHGTWGWLTGGLMSFSYLAASVGQTPSAEAAVYQMILLLIASLAIIWALRQTFAGATVRIRDAYYKGMYPLVPFVLVLLVMSLQLLPMAIGFWLYQVVVANGIAVSVAEQAFWAVIAIIFAILSLYMLCSSLFALYISALPDMTPMKALRSARSLVLYRRRHVVRKFLFLAMIVLLAIVVVMLPVIVFVPVVAPWVFYILGIICIGYTHTYLYGVYRELLADAA